MTDLALSDTKQMPQAISLSMDTVIWICHPVGPVLAFVQERLSAGLTPAMLKVYVAAIAAGHVPIDGMLLGRHFLISCFLCGEFLPGIFPMVLEGLLLVPFEPLESVSKKLLG